MSQAPYGPGPAAPAPWPPQGPPSTTGGPSRIPTVVAIVLALVATAVAISAWFRPAPKPEAPAIKTYSEQEVADAKKAVCDAFETSISTLDVNKRKSSVNTADPFAVTVNTRLMVQAIADYLTHVTVRHPALQSDISSIFNDLSDAYQDIVLKQIGDADQAELDAAYQHADQLQDSASQACK